MRISDWSSGVCSSDLPTFGHHVSAELTADNGDQLYMPVGFGHAFVTLQPDTEVSYKVSDYYAPECDGGVHWNCPQIGIDWPLHASGPILSDRKSTRLNSSP